MAKQSISEIRQTGNWPEGPTPPIGPGKSRLQWNPKAVGQPQQQSARFAVPGPETKPSLTYLDQAHIDELMARIEAEEAQPPHKRNAALIGDLKRQALEMMRRVESLWVQRTADELLPRLDE